MKLNSPVPNPIQFRAPRLSALSKILVAFIVMLGLLSVLFILYFIPQVHDQHTRQLEEEMRVAIELESDFFTRLIDDRVSDLQSVANRPAIINSVMQSEKNSFELIGLLESFRLIGDPTDIFIYDLAGEVIYQNQGSSTAIDSTKVNWATQILNGGKASHFEVIGVHGRTLHFLLAIPVRYGDYVEGMLVAKISTPLKRLFHSSTERSSQFEITQGEITASLHEVALEAPYSISKEIEKYGVTVTYTTSTLQSLQFQEKLRYIGLIVLLGMMLVALALTLYIGRSGSNTNSESPLNPTSSFKIRRNPELSQLSNYLLPSLILIFGMATSFVAYHIVRDLDDQNYRDQATARAKSQVQMLEEEIARNIDVLRALASYLRTVQQPKLENFERFTAPLLAEHKSIQTVAWIPRVLHEERQSYVNEARIQGYDNFHFLELVDGERVLSRIRDIYYPMYYVSPLKGNESGLGYDFGSNPAQFSAIHETGTSEEFVASAPALIDQEGSDEFAILIFAPIYDTRGTSGEAKEAKGIALLALRAVDVVESLAESIDEPLDFDILDVTDTKNNVSIFHSKTKSTGVSQDTTTVYSETFSIGGRRWLVSVSDQKHPVTAISWTAILVLLMGCLFSVLASIYIVNLSHRKTQVEQLVRVRTREIQELSTAMENAVEGVSQLNGKGEYTYVNEAYARACGYTPSELLGRAWAITVEPSQLPALENSYDSMIETGRVTTEAVGVRKDGSNFQKSLTMVSRYNKQGGFIGHYCFMADITARKKAEENLINSNIELERFAFLASHDLQEPIRMVSNFTELLKEEYAKDMDETALEYMHFITDGASRMRVLINDLLSYAKLDGANEKLKATNCNHELSVVLRNLDESIKNVEAVVTKDALPVIQATPIRINRLLQNLVGNALKYSRLTGTPTVHVGCLDREDDWLFSVSDNGIGMDKGSHEKIFTIFTRLHHRRDYAGTGIGLAICKKIVISMGGKIWAESDINVGTTIFFTIPKNQIEHLEKHAEHTDVTVAKKQRSRK